MFCPDPSTTMEYYVSSRQIMANFPCESVAFLVTNTPTDDVIRNEQQQRPPKQLSILRNQNLQAFEVCLHVNRMFEQQLGVSSTIQNHMVRFCKDLYNLMWLQCSQTNKRVPIFPLHLELLRRVREKVEKTQEFFANKGHR